jgi:hypothetical protein
MHGKRTCYHHGGATPNGYGLPQTTHGRYSKVLPLRLAARYHESLRNPELLSLKDDIAAVEARLSDLFQRVDSGESGQLWQAVRQALTEFSTAVAAGNVATFRRHFATLQHLVTQGSDDAAAWRDILATWETRCKLTTTQARLLVAAQQVVSTQELMVMLGVITDAINRAVSTHAEPSVARRILGDLSEEFTRIGLRAGGAEA